jgi:hemerythrin-like domain-containing protein
MMYSNRVCQKLHDEHLATLALLERLERFVAKQEPPAAIDSATRTFLIDLAVAFESEVWHHFDFEEKHLFDYLVAAGDTELARHLSDEHVQIKAVGQHIIAMARAACVSAPDRDPSRNRTIKLISNPKYE